MNDAQRTAEINNLIEKAKKHGKQYLEVALQVAEAIEDPDDKTSYIAIIAQELATIGTLTDLDRALQLGRMTKPIDKWTFAFKGVFARLVAENEIKKALQVVEELESVALEFEADNEYDYVIRSDMWNEIGDMYEKTGENARAQQMWMNAVRLAQAGQNSPRRQDEVECYKVLRGMAKKLQKTGHTEDAVNIARSITHELFRESTLKDIAEWQDNK